jgi:hypothetical protein
MNKLVTLVEILKRNLFELTLNYEILREYDNEKKKISVLKGIFNRSEDFILKNKINLESKFLII